MLVGVVAAFAMRASKRSRGLVRVEDIAGRLAFEDAVNSGHAFNIISESVEVPRGPNLAELNTDRTLGLTNFN